MNNQEDEKRVRDLRTVMFILLVCIIVILLIRFVFDILILKEKFHKQYIV